MSDDPRGENRSGKGEDPEEKYRSLRIAGMLSTAGLTLALSIGIGIGIGIVLDRWFHTRWLTILFAVLGVVAGFQQLIRIVNQAGAEQDKQESEERARRRNGPRRDE